MLRKRHNRDEILQRVRKVSADLSAGVPIEQISAQHHVDLPTLKRWLRDFGPSPAEGSSRLKSLEQENRRLRRTVANLELDNKVLAEALQGNF
jgi:putative transposase